MFQYISNNDQPSTDIVPPLVNPDFTSIRMLKATAKAELDKKVKRLMTDKEEWRDYLKMMRELKAAKAKPVG